MINNFYSSVSNGNLVDKCSHKQHHVPELPYLLKNNFLSEFRTSLEKAKVRANLGIADSETLYWGNILGDIAQQLDISGYINNLLSFDYSIQNTFDAGDNFLNIKNVRDAAITCLDYLSKFKGEGAEILAVDLKVKEILRNLYAVDSLDNVEESQGGVINELTSNILTLQQQLGNPNTTVEDIESKLNTVESEVNAVNEILTDINSLLVKYVPKDGSTNALLIIEDTVEEIDGEQVTYKGGLYVKDLLPQIDELNADINGDSGKISVLLLDIETNTQGIEDNKSSINTLELTTIPEINKEISNIKKDYVSKASLGSSSSIVTDDKLTTKLDLYIKKDTTASILGITSENESIEVNKPLEFTTNDPGDSRRYVLTKADLLKITNYWPGMEVIVIEDALMYILKKDGDPSDPTYDGWKIADALKIEVLTREEFEERLKAGDLNPLVYYYIYSLDIIFKEYPKREDYETDAEFKYAEELWRNDAYILQGLYMSAAWGQDLDNRIKYKVDKANFETLTTRVSTIESFFNSTSGDTLASLKESIQTIYKPAYTETDASGKPVSIKESGLLVTLSDKVNAIDARVTTLENAGFVKWSEVGTGNNIVTDDKLLETLEDYITKDSTASLEKITSKNNTIKTDKPIEVITQKPLDERHYVLDYEDLFTVNPNTAFEGMEVIVKSEGIIMMLQDLTNIDNDKGWKNVGLASIVELTLEEYQLRSDNTNEDGTSKGHKYSGTEKEIPTLLGNVYYFIKETPITFTKLPERNERSDEEWIADLETWKNDTYLLWHLFLTASWGEDMNAKVNNKVDKATYDTNNKITNENRAYILDIQSLLEVLNAYFENIESVKIKDIIDAATLLKTKFDILSSDYNNVKLDLYGNETTKAKFVTWTALGGEGEDALEGGKTLFVKTTVYEADRLSDSKKFTTEELVFPGKKTIHHDAVEEVSHIDAVSGEKIVDIPAVEAYDEEILDPLSITRNNERIKVGTEEVAFKEDLLKSIEFDSYPIYYSWINGNGTIDGQEGSQTYAEWSVDKNLEEWYFLIKYDGTVLPPKNTGESDVAYEARIEPFKKGMLLTVYDAETIYATKGALQAATDTLLARVNYADTKIENISRKVNEQLTNLDTHINAIETNLNTICAQLKKENILINEETKNIFYTAWGRFYNSVDNICTDLGTIIDTSETKLTKQITAFLKVWTTRECERIAAKKLEESTFKQIWDTYYTENEGVITYTPLKTLIASIVGDGEDGDSLSLTSLKALVDLRETITDHAADITAVRQELADAIDDTRAFAVAESAKAQNAATNACLSAIPINYSYLKYLRDTGGLVLGRYYRIIDYKTTSKESNTKVIWHPFDIIVKADSYYELSETAYAAIPDEAKSSLIIGGGGGAPVDPTPGGDPDPDLEGTPIETVDDDDIGIGTLDDEGGSSHVDLYYMNCNLAAWELKYTIDNDATRYSWVDDRYTVIEAFNTYSEGDTILVDTYNELSSTNKAKCVLNGKGVIYYMKDEFGNECSYDFKSILFERFYIEALTSLKNMSNWIVNQYYSALSATLENQETIIPHYKSLNGEGATTRFFYTFDTGGTALFLNAETGLYEDRPVELTWYNANNSKNTCRDNHFAYPCNLYNVVLNGTGTTILIDKNKIVLGNNVFIGSDFVSNTCNDLGFAYNTILNGMSFNTFGGNFAFNIISSNFTNNKFGYDCKLNIINSGFNYNTVGNKFQKNCISTYCENNTFRELIVNNALSHHNTENIFGNNIHDCEFPDYFKNNELGGDTVELKIADTAHYMLFCYFNKGIHLITILDSQLRSNASKWYQYIHFNWSYFSTLTNIDLCGGEFYGARNKFSISPGNNYIIEIQDSSTAHQGYVWCPADIIVYIKGLYDTVESLQKLITDMGTRVSNVERQVSNFELIINNEKAYSDSIAAAVKQLAGYHNTSFELERADVTIVGSNGESIVLPGNPSELTNN